VCSDVHLRGWRYCMGGTESQWC